MTRILILGNGYIGKRCAEAWKEKAILAPKKIASAADALALLEEYKPDAVLNAAGVKGKPNVDWCETHQPETLFGNVAVPLFLAFACHQKNTYLLHIGSGCVFYGDSPDPLGWKEDDFANPSAVYSQSKYAADLLLKNFPNVGIARIRMPMDFIPSPGNIIDKLASYSQVIDVENSITVVEDMVEVFYTLLEKKASGIFHVVNPGTIKHREILAYYKKYVDPSHNCTWISEDALVKQGLAAKKRSTNKLQSLNLEKLDISMRPVHIAVQDTMQRYALLKKR
ncbi:sugar nucleotide-binding protein [Candidatus Woesearchaeota archaeon]|nr:sugar nucleotide-binding protein [Candidatus Woesearchaeota archaeon]